VLPSRLGLGTYSPMASLSGGGAANKIRMEEMNWPDVRAAVVAVGSTEQHGPHLPTMTDTRIGDAMAYRVALKLGGALQARTIPVGVSDHHLAFGATVSLKPETLMLIVRDYVDSLVRDGFRRIVFLPSHGGNFGTVARAVKRPDPRKLRVPQRVHPILRIEPELPGCARGHHLGTRPGADGPDAPRGGHLGDGDGEGPDRDLRRPCRHPERRTRPAH